MVVHNIQHFHQTAPFSCWFAVTRMIIDWAVRQGYSRARESVAMDPAMRQVFQGQTTPDGQGRGGINYQALSQPQMLEDLALRAIHPWERTPAAWTRYLTTHGPLMYMGIANGTRRHAICVYGINGSEVMIDDPEPVGAARARAAPELSFLLANFPPVPGMPLLHAAR